MKQILYALNEIYKPQGKGFNTVNAGTGIYH